MHAHPNLFPWGACGLLLAAAGLPGVAAAQPAECGTLEPARWMIGRWVAESDQERITEEWRSLGAETFEGAGATYSRETGARTGGESLRLAAMSGGVYYIAKVAHNAYPVAFTLTSCGDGRLVFENPTHDFPRRLEYTFTAPDAMTVRVSDGGAKGFVLEFRRTD